MRCKLFVRITNASPVLGLSMNRENSPLPSPVTLNTLPDGDSNNFKHCLSACTIFVPRAVGQPFAAEKSNMVRHPRKEGDAHD